ncbi:carbohydrate ABC transporter permease [Actinopolymorpha pittospori]|uniref:Raffinose/stachyose/melibiose transport system permease protein n=1 Tax=Actinopolymorpha pittospori TaxID=648752 RepID=A0A927RFH6_9ACTN|nr:carbohydrate ABC transporter permease [Actinopolymorpha pittospori]MBE1603226.1 raffinose/stachyose/melibiose transport system permease protein [Actinopolymorpha pittospori]
MSAVPSAARVATRPARKTSRRLGVWLQVLILAVICLVWIYPLLWIASASFKSPLEVFSGGLGLLPQEWHPENYLRAWRDGGFSGYMLNSILVTVGTVVVTVVRCALAGYALARRDFVGRRVVIGVLVATLFAPAGLTIIPVVELSDLLGLLDTRTGMVLALSGGGHVAAVLLYAGFFRRIPRELEEAAVIDGAGFLRTFVQVMLPVARPVTATVAVMTLLSSWNNFFVPLVFTFSRPDLRTLSVGMLAFRGVNSTDWSGLAAAATLSLIPILLVFFALQRYFVEGVAGAVKS